MGWHDFNWVALCTVALALQVAIVICADSSATTASPELNVTSLELNFTSPSNESTVFFLSVQYNESSTTTIHITWDVPETNDIRHYYVQSRRKDRSDIIRSPPLPSSRRNYVIHDLVRNSEYQVCVYAHFDNETSTSNCTDMGTIPLIRDDSLIGVFCALGYILLMILLGYLVWRYHKRKSEKKLLESEEGSRSEEEGEKLNPNSAPAQYLGPPGSDVPRSSIEDQDIPYITPPVEQLSDEEKDQFRKSTIV